MHTSQQLPGRNSRGLQYLRTGASLNEPAAARPRRPPARLDLGRQITARTEAVNGGLNNAALERAEGFDVSKTNIRWYVCSGRPNMRIFVCGSRYARDSRGLRD